MKANMSRVKNTEQVDSLGLMEALTMVNSLKIISKVKENTTGPMAENTMDNG